jgi:hypothetical protein
MRSLRDCVPSLLAMKWVYVDTHTTTHQTQIYEHDKNEFARMGKRRNAFIRPEHPYEFDWEIGLLERIKMPTLRVLVFRLAPGIHVRVPVFRGSEPVNTDVFSDGELGIVLETMARKLGMNLGECLTYETQRKMESDASEAVN